MIPKFLLGVIEKNRERVKQNKEKRLNNEIQSGGFTNKSDYYLFQQRAKEEAKQKIEKANRKKLRKEIQEKITYDLTHTKLERFGDSVRKTQKNLKNTNKQMKGDLKKNQNYDNFSFNPVITTDAYGMPLSKKTKKSKTPSKKKKPAKKKKTSTKRKSTKRKKIWYE